MVSLVLTFAFDRDEVESHARLVSSTGWAEKILPKTKFMHLHLKNSSSDNLIC